jgi:hypothetical protein
MKNFIPVDHTQREILGHLGRTEELLTAAVSRVAGREREALVIPMPDLGLPRSVQRAWGGFFTGMVARWDCPEPFVPVDATVNVCAVGVYRLPDGLEDEAAFDYGIHTARARCVEQDCSYKWNFDEGNHFVLLTEVGEGAGFPAGRYLVLHASASEFKRGHNGLYPVPGNWYSDRIEQVADRASGRVLRYLHGATAERFFCIADQLVEFNRTRLHYFAEQIAGREVEEMQYQPHYGMPDRHSVAIGCQWLPPGAPSLLLTRPGQPLFWVEPGPAEGNRIQLAERTGVLMPHGFGVEVAGDLSLTYHADGLTVNGKSFCGQPTFKTVPGLMIRGGDEPVETTAARLLAPSGSRIVGQMAPIFSYSSQRKVQLCH